MKTYVITLSQVFPTTHPLAGKPTGFKFKMLSARHNVPCTIAKFHTIRANYYFWRKRFEKIAAGEACLSIREWAGKPYAKGSTQREIIRLTKDDGIGIQKLDFCRKEGTAKFVDGILRPFVDGKRIDRTERLANNDGLSFDDWCDWFKDYDLLKPMAIIHFTKFRY